MAQIEPDRVQINTVTRPPAEEYAFPVGRLELQKLAAAFGNRAEVIAEYRPGPEAADFTTRREDIVALLRRRPCTIEDLVQGLGLHRSEVVKYVNKLVERNVLEVRFRGRTPYYGASAGTGAPDASRRRAPDAGDRHDNP